MISAIANAWLIIPLLFGDKLQGIVLLRESEVAGDLNWEDRDLLKVAGKQAAVHLAQFQADRALVESRQFEAFNRLSAYVIHDLKNVLAQLSLIVANAKKHKKNPEFIDDMVDTVSNTVDRMSKLMTQLRSETLRAQQQEFKLIELLENAVDNGTGMDNQFIRHRLFKPFDSTKGLTGMGIGVFESRDFIHSLGGEINVISAVGQGSIFRVLIPCVNQAGARHASPIS